MRAGRSIKGQAGGIEGGDEAAGDDQVGIGGMLCPDAVDIAEEIAVAARDGIGGHDAAADLVGDGYYETGPFRGRTGSGAGEVEDLIIGQILTEEICDPEGEAVDDGGGVGRGGGEGMAEVDGLLDGRPTVRAFGLMGGDADGHFVVAGLGGGDESDGARVGGGEPDGETAFAGSSAAGK